MVRWEPGAADRLRAAALDLYTLQGFEQTTVAEIAAAAGVTERTFFRHFADKREVLFEREELLAKGFLEGVATAPADAAPLEIVAHALAASAPFFSDDRRSWSRRRQSVIDLNPALQERELLKLARLAAMVAAALRERGVVEPAASLAAESGLIVLRVSFGRWIAEGERRPLGAIEQAVLQDLRVMTAPAIHPTEVPTRPEATS
ncbi:TetR/AcrR family transcriptional regulator [Micromonospora sp. 067-2]|uniref:TetR/AcrR family transcriptional regulator n=1 Tax=Micromonospora sp. 067-2 TaxID=2789270 RepID=UPI00397CE8FA